jgi:hypothetical protein
VKFLDGVMRAIGYAAEKPADGFRPGSDAAIERLVRELANCPVCGKAFDGHSIALFAHTVLEEKSRKRVSELFDALDERRWRDMQGFCEWNARAVNAEVYVVRCTTGDAAVAILHSSLSPADFKNVERCACAGGESARELLKLIPPSKWKAISPPSSSGEEHFLPT